MKSVELYTDGACSQNPGPGGWACILVYQGKEKTLSGGEPQTTNNRMELQGVIHGLEQLKEMEAMLSNVLMSLESTHKKLAEKHRNCTAKTREQKKKVEEIEVMLQSLKKDYLETTAQDNALIEEMNGISASHYDKTTKIQRVRDRIKELSRILLFVYADGTIAIENSDMVLDESGSDELYRKLTEKDECEKLRMKEIRVLARVLKGCSHLPEDTEIVFDNAEIEKAFKILSAS